MKCAWCGQDFDTPNGQYKKYCSPRCHIEADKYRKITGKKVPDVAREFDCAHCGKHVVTGYNDSRTRFCSHECHRKYYNIEYQLSLRGKKHADRNG